ncbi:MAG: hypothetical protein AB7J28_16565 [Hyphomonadaceae bacterium]
MAHTIDWENAAADMGLAALCLDMARLRNSVKRGKRAKRAARIVFTGK